MGSRRHSESRDRKSPVGGRWTYGVLALALLFVLMPFLIWNATWFGRPMTDEQLAGALVDRRHPRDIQHALAQIEARMEAGDPSVRRWYPQVVSLATNPLPEIRLTAAWVMGQDNSVPKFHETLRRLLSDPQPMVQRNAALALVRFGDATGRPQIRALLEPYALPAPSAGRLRIRLKPGDFANPGTLLAQLEAAGGKREVRATVPGTILRWAVSDRSAVTAGQALLLLAPDQKMVSNALAALYLIGRPEDLSAIDPYARGSAGMPPEIQQQALQTERAIRSRSGS